MAKIRDGSSYLSEHLTDNDYYTSDVEKVVGRWVGEASARLGIEGNSIKAGDESFERIRQNQHPQTGERLTPCPHTSGLRKPSFNEAYKELADILRYKGDGHEPSDLEVENYRAKMDQKSNRICFYDVQCSAPKSVSVLAQVIGDERLRQAHTDSLDIAFSELESLAVCRSNESLGRLKRHEFTGNIAAAVFQHDSSRSCDPQIHSHLVTGNCTWSESRQQWMALSEFEMVKAIRYLGWVYENELGKRVQALGYEIRKEQEKGVTTGWGIAGVPEEVCRTFSQRRQAIESEIEIFKGKHGRPPTRAEISAITKETREAKLKGQSAAKVREKQLARLKTEQVDVLKSLVENAKPRSVPAGQKESAALETAVAHLYERKSVQRAHEILAEALASHVGELDLKKLKDSLAGEGCGTQFLANETSNPLLAEFCTKEGCELEQWSVDFIARTNNKFAPLASFAELEGSRLSDEQKEAVKFICRTTNQICAIRGLAGSGKSTLLKNLKLQLQACGREMIFVAPTSSAVKSLQASGFESATTVADYLTHAKKKPYVGAVVIVDEAGLQSNRQGAEVLRLAQMGRQRLVLIGDSRQHVAVQAGDFLRVLESHSQLETRELKDIKRQVIESYRSAIVAMADGHTSLGMSALDELGWVHECDAEYLHQAASAWMHQSEQGAKPDKVIAVCPTWEENFSLSDMIRDRLKAEGKLSESIKVDSIHSLKWTTERKRKLAEVIGITPGLLVTPTLKMDGLEQSRSYAVESVKDGWVKLEGVNRSINPKKDAVRFDVGIRRRLEVAQGDQLLIRMNDKARDLVNGQVLTVEAVRSDGSIQTQCGKEIPATFRQFAYGYCSTSHKAQGRTAKHVIVAAEKLDSKSAYVAASRGRESCAMFTPDKERLFAGLPFSGDRRAALDVLKEQRQAARQRISRPLSVLNRIKIAVARRVSRLGDRLRKQAATLARADMLRGAELQMATKRKML